MIPAKRRNNGLRENALHLLCDRGVRWTGIHDSEVAVRPKVYFGLLFDDLTIVKLEEVFCGMNAHFHRAQPKT